MPSPDRFIASCRSWNDFWDRTRKLSNTEKGVAFGRLTQLYLQTAPEYRTKLQHVWLLRDVPVDIRRRLNLPAPDEGIDLIARTRSGEYWAIQSKFRSQRDKPLSRRELGTFTSLAFNTCNNIALAVVAHTATKPVSKRHLMRNTVEIGLIPDVQRLDLAYVSCAAGPAKPDGKLKRNWRSAAQPARAGRSDRGARRSAPPRTRETCVP
jgi:hypothetical protein